MDSADHIQDCSTSASNVDLNVIPMGRRLTRATCKNLYRLASKLKHEQVSQSEENSQWEIRSESTELYQSAEKP